VKATVEVQNRHEADAVKAALGDPAIKAFVVVIGALQTLQDDEKARCLGYVKDWINYQANTKAQ
jgi:hypothetical protein